MKRIIFFLPFLFSAGLYARDGYTDNSFDRKVEQLFFNKDVSTTSLALIDSLADDKELDYTKPEGYTTYFMMGGMMGVYKHVFDFKQSPDSSIGFDEGSIQVLVYANDSRIGDITWQLEYSKKEDAVAAFSDLFEHLCVPGVEHYLYHGKEIIEEAQFINKASRKYPHVSFKLIDKKGSSDGMYKIRLSLS